MFKQSSFRVLVVVSWLGSLSFITGARCAVWGSELALWTNATRQAPEKPRPFINLGRAREVAGDYDGAEQAYRMALSRSFADERRHPAEQAFAMAAAETNIAHVYMVRGWHASAMRILDQVLVGWPNFPYAHLNRSAILSVAGACGPAHEAYVIAAKFPLRLPPPPECEEAP